MTREWLSAFWVRRKSLILAFSGGLAAASVIAGIGALTTVVFGLYNTAALSPHTKPVSWALHKTFKQSVKLRSRHIVAPARFTQAQVISGFKQYQADCMMCHGGPGIARADWVKGLEPTPPFLLDAGKRWSAAELDYILEDGVKMSAMPSWGATRTADQIWSIVAFLKALPGISPRQFAVMQRSYPADTLAPAPRVFAVERHQPGVTGNLR